MSTRNYDATQLNIATQKHMKNLGFTLSKYKVGDGVWERGKVIYFIEEKTERESLYPPNNWWKHSNNLLGQRNYIRDIYKEDNLIKLHQNKWMIVIAQLRSDVTNFFNKYNIDKNYRCIFAVPGVETKNFKQGFARYNMDLKLNINNGNLRIDLKNWRKTYTYCDQRGININTKIIEINCDNYFG